MIPMWVASKPSSKEANGFEPAQAMAHRAATLATAATSGPFF
jgi:hypothetical protein